MYTAIYPNKKKGKFCLCGEPVTRATLALRRHIIPFWNWDDPSSEKLPLGYAVGGSFTILVSRGLILSVCAIQKYNNDPGIENLSFSFGPELTFICHTTGR